MAPKQPLERTQIDRMLSPNCRYSRLNNTIAQVCREGGQGGKVPQGLKVQGDI